MKTKVKTIKYKDGTIVETDGNCRYTIFPNGKTSVSFRCKLILINKRKETK